VLGDQYIFEYLPIHRGIISPNFFVPAYICQLYNPFITRKSFGKLQIKAGIIKGFLLKHAFFEAPTYNALLPLWKDVFSCLIRIDLHSIRKGTSRAAGLRLQTPRERVYLFQLLSTFILYCNLWNMLSYLGMNGYMLRMLFLPHSNWSEPSFLLLLLCN
jgi:hypothetical protein